MKKNLLALSIASLLVGCGGGDGGSSSSSNSGPSIPPTGTFIAYNGLTIVKPDEINTIDLRNYVEGGHSLEAFSSNGQECEVQSIDRENMNFSVKFDKGAYCLYDYEVKSESGQARFATLTVLSTAAEKPSLPSVSRAINVGSTDQEFDIEALLGNDWLSSYTLNASSVSVVAGEDSIEGAPPRVSGNTITFDAPLQRGWNRILYTVSDSANPDIQLLGTIHVTISDDVNDAPVISQLNYDYTDPIIASQSEEIDVAALTGLTITDDGDWQLIDVQSFTANVVELDPNSVTNTAFTFVTPTIGEHVVSYTVADHMGGFATGLINITVSPNERDMTWSDIGIETTVGSYKYTATPRYSDVATQLSVGNTWDAVVENTVATFSFEQADLYCSGNGRVPSLDEIKRLYEFGRANRETSGDFSVIPKQLPYISYSYTDSNAQLFDMNNGTSSAATADSIGYVSCIKDFSFDLEVINTRAVANLDPTPIARITKGRDTTVTVSIVPISLSDGDVNVAEVVETDNEMLLLASGTVAGTFRVSIEADGDTLTTPIITMTGDAAAAAVSGISYDELFEDTALGKLTAGVGDTLTATVDVKDIYNNVISDKLVVLEPVSATTNDYCYQPPADDEGVSPPQECYSGEITFSSGKELLTDANGQVNFTVEATRDMFRVDSADVIIDWDYNVRVNDDVYTDTIKIVHPDYESVVLVTELNRTARYVDFRLNVANLAEELTSGRLQFVYPNHAIRDFAYLLNEDGSVGGKVNNNTGYNTTIDGVTMRLSRNPTLSNSTLDDSVFRASILASTSADAIKDVVMPYSEPKAYYTRELPIHIGTVPFETIDGITIVPATWIESLAVDNYDIYYIYRTSSNNTRVVALPAFGPEDYGIIINLWNKAANSWFVDLVNKDSTHRHEILGGRGYRSTFMWFGDHWKRIVLISE